MCNRISTPKVEHVKLFANDKEIKAYREYYHANAFSHPELPVTVSEDSSKIQTLSWGLIPAWAKDEKTAKELRIKTVNCKGETMWELPSFRDSAKKRRCLIYVNGFFEWRHEGTEKIPHFIHADGQIMTFGGLWSSWTNKETGEVIDSCTVVTTPANEVMSYVHNSKLRMPLILEREHWDMWLDTTAKPEHVSAIIKPLRDGVLKAHQVSKLITSRTHDPNVPEVQAEVRTTLF